MEATLKIYSVIGTDENEFSSNNLISFLDSNQSATDLTIRIKSPGGSVREGWTIHDLLKNSGKKIKTIAEGELYSIATVIFLAGSEREIFPNADGLIHMPRIPNPEGDFQAADLRDMASFMDQEEEKILNLYVTETNQDKELLRDYMVKETMLSADDMVRLGFATKKIEPIKAVAYYNFKTNKMEKDEVKTFGEKLDAFGETLKALFSRLPATDQKLVDKDWKEFNLAKESGAPAVGDKATPDGTFVMADGKTVVISGGAVTAVDDAMMDKSELEIANEKIAALEAEKVSLTAKVAESETIKVAALAEKAAFEEEKVKAVALVTELKALKNTWKPEGRTRFGSVDKIGDVNLDQVREIIKNKKDK